MLNNGYSENMSF